MSRRTIVNSFSAIRLLLLGGLLAVASCSERGVEADRTPISAPASAPPAAGNPEGFEKTWSLANAEYAGSESCRECHEKRARDFAETKHARAARLPARDSFSGSFDSGENVYRTRDTNLWYEMTSEGTNFFQTRVVKTSAGERREKKQASIVYGLGSLDEICLFWEGNRIHEMPIAYAAPLKQWINAPGYTDGVADFSHGAETCLTCHNTHIEPLAGKPGEFSREGMEISITCEKCHGPGSEHADYHRAHPDEVEGRYVADPGTMTAKQRNDLCSECHSDVGQPLQPMFSYRPGAPLEDFYHVSTIQKDRESQHTANYIRYLERSACFTKGDSLSCVTCHNPHVPEGVGNSLSVKRSCLGCHEAAHCGEREKLPVPVRDLCLDCHMPERPDMHTAFHGPEKLHVPGRMRREHRIGVFPLATRQVLARHYRGLSDADSGKRATELAASIVEELLGRGGRLAKESKFSTAMSAYRAAREFTEDVPAVDAKLEELAGLRERLLAAFNEGVIAVGRGDLERGIERLKEAVAIDPGLALAEHHLGVAYQTLGDQQEAIHRFNRALELDPELPASHAQLGFARHVGGDITGAITAYRRALELKPRSSETHNNLAMALRAKGDAAEAEREYRLALELDADNASARNNLGSLLLLTGRTPEALATFREAVRLAPDYADAHFNLAGALRMTGDMAGAISEYARAVEVGAHRGARNNLAMLLTMTGRRVEAIPHFEAILKETPDSIPHLIFLSKILAAAEPESSRDPARALELADRAVAATGGANPDTLEARALALAAGGKFEEAATVIEQAARIAERGGAADLAAAIRMLGESYRQRQLPPTDALFPKPPN